MCGFRPCLILVLALFGPYAAAQEPQLKARRNQKTGQLFQVQQEPKRWLAGRVHLLVQVPAEAGEEFYALLESRGIRALAHVPDQWLSVSAPEDADWSGLEILAAGALAASDKLSPELGSLEQEAVIVEFHPDVPPAEARAIASAEGLERIEHPDLLPWQLLVRGLPSQLASLAAWDEVAYAFPAASELTEGRPVTVCMGGQAGGLSVAPFVARIGEGWDGPGRNRASLSYYFDRTSEKLPAPFIRAEIERALAQWAQFVDIRFTPAAIGGSSRMISVSFATLSHGDPFSFDGPGRLLAHTFYPAPPNPEPIAGDMHLDDDENWADHNEIDLYSVALHEVGHALGLGHSDRPGAVMYPVYRRSTELTPEDIAAVRELYATAGVTQPTPLPSPLAITSEATIIGYTASLEGAVSGGTGEPVVTWSSDRGGSGIAVGGRTWSVASLPLLPGLNSITTTATDASGVRASRILTLYPAAQPVALQLTITSPTTAVTYQSPSPTLAVGGTSAGAVRVTWTSSRGAAGECAGNATWSTGPIALQTGSNVIVIVAYAPGGASISRSLDVQVAGGRDATPPSILIQSPTGTSTGTSADAMVFRGAARDNVGVAEVTWSSSNGFTGVATGTTSWSTSPIPLLVGVNQITVRAHDAAGNSRWRSVTVTRR